MERLRKLHPGGSRRYGRSYNDGMISLKENALQLILAFLAAAVLSAAAPAAAVVPAPYAATYSVTYRGLDGGLIRFELHEEKEGSFIFESRAQPSLLARLFVTENAVERTVMRIDADGVRPLSWYTEDGKSGEKKDGELEFAWEGGTVRGKVKGKDVDLPTEPGLQDRLSVQIAVMHALLRGEEPGTIPMVADDRIKRYIYTRARQETVATPAGEFDAVLYESTRPGSDRLSRVWYAPALGYIPVRAEQLRDGKLETVVQMVNVEREGKG